MCHPLPVFHISAHHEPAFHHSLLCGLSDVGGLLTPLYVRLGCPISPAAHAGPDGASTAIDTRATTSSSSLLPDRYADRRSISDLRHYVEPHIVEAQYKSVPGSFPP